MICDPLRKLEIVMPCTGAAALIVTSSDRAKDARLRPVYLLGGGQSIDSGMWTPAYGRDASLTTSPVKPAAQKAFDMAGLTIRDMGFVQLYGCYTITVTIALEDIGCCAKGEGARFVENTDLTFQGALPLNTDGGQLGRGQPYGACHFMPAVEAARQLMGRAAAGPGRTMRPGQRQRRRHGQRMRVDPWGRHPVRRGTRTAMSTARPHRKPLPEILPETAGFWRAARRRELVLQRCAACGQLIHFPRMISNVVHVAPSRVTVGMRVQAAFEDVTAEVSLPKLEPA